jgi:hypothetical protein
VLFKKVNYYINYGQSVVGLKAAIRKDYMETRQCKLTIAVEDPLMKQVVR